eukprot:SM000095S24953  [mRNA]  locus=s95:149392:151656:+ [translate_table: standard]
MTIPAELHRACMHASASAACSDEGMPEAANQSERVAAERVLAGARLRAELVQREGVLHVAAVRVVEHGVPRWVLRTLEVSGDGRFWIPAPLAIWLAPQSPRLPLRLRWFAFLTFAAYLVDLAVIGVLKVIVRRPRPSYNTGRPQILYSKCCPSHNVVVSVDKWSFPSGHASRTILTASLCFLQWPMLAAMLPPPFDGPLIFVFATIWAVSTSTSRILLGRHYFLDVIAGALLGVAEALATELIMSASPRTTAALRSLATSCYHRDAGCRLERFSFVWNNWRH